MTVEVPACDEVWDGESYCVVEDCGAEARHRIPVDMRTMVPDADGVVIVVLMVCDEHRSPEDDCGG